MQESENIKKKLKFVEELTDKISRLLEKDEGKEDKEINELYKQRRKAVEELREMIISGEAKKFIEDPDNLWNERIASIMEKDKINMDKLEKRTKGIGEKLKNIYKQKNLLIYKKEQDYGR